VERCWQFIKAAIGGIPKKLLVTVDWETDRGFVNLQDASITIGMAQPAAAADPKSFLLHAVAREMSRLGLLISSEGRAARPESRFLLEGMSEILAHDYERTSRNLGGAWVIAHFLGRMKLLGLARQSSEPEIWGSDVHTLRSAAPGITFLVSCREQFGREKLFKFFESLKKNDVSQALFDAFRTRPEALESTWLQKVRDYDVSQEITTTSAEDAPALERVTVAAPASPGRPLQLHFFVRDRLSNLSPDALFVHDPASGVVQQGRAESEGAQRYMSVQLPIEDGRKPGDYPIRVTAIDDVGNVRSWNQSYTIK
jgi:hypothetical protein